MRWITLLLQVISFRSSLLESKALLENAKAAAEKGKRAAAFSGMALGASIYFFVGTVLAIIELGLQVDRGQGIHFSGLLGAALALIVLAALILFGASFILKSGEKEKEEPRETTFSDGRLKGAIEEFLLTFITQSTEKMRKKEGAGDP